MNAPNADYLALDDAALLDQCHLHIHRASGPGGQKRNKTSSAIRLRHTPTELMVVATESRSQHENKRRALRRLRMAIALNARRPFDPATDSPSHRLRDCVAKDGRLVCGPRDERYPPVVRDLLDIFCALEARTAETARALNISTAHLTAFLRKDPKLLARANQLRTNFGHRSIG